MRLFPLIFILLGMGTLGFVTDSAADHLENSDYLLEGTGFVVTDKAIQKSLLNIEFVPQSSEIVSDGVISLSGVDYFFSDQWKGNVVRDGRFLLFSGYADNSKDEKIHVALFGRLVDETEGGSVYTFNGIVKDNDRKNKVSFVSKTINIVKAQKTLKQTSAKSIQVDILFGASRPGNAEYYSLPTVEIIPGTTVIWKNNDSVSHRIMSGTGGSYTGDAFTPDGKIKSGDILPGETFQVTINELGITRFFDTKYHWMDGIILSMPETDTTSLRHTFPS